MLAISSYILSCNKIGKQSRYENNVVGCSVRKAIEVYCTVTLRRRYGSFGAESASVGVSECRSVGGAESRDHPSSAVGAGFYPPLPEHEFIFSCNHLRVVHHDGFEWMNSQ